jgi:membrane-associated phospholipid phosphatase
MSQRGTILAVLIYFAGFWASTPPIAAQVAESPLPDSPSQVQEQHVEEHPAITREETFRTLPRDFLHDQKQIWLFPTLLAKGKHWVPTVAIIGVTAGLIGSDPHSMPYFRAHQRNWDDFNDTFNSYLTSGEIIAVPAALLVAGYKRHDDYQVSTALLAGEAYADGAIVDLAIKAVTRRQRPSDVLATGNFSDTFFNGGKSPFKGSSFPSGHAVGVFSVATTVAQRYHRHKWVPFLAYGFATAISASRVTTLSHFPSDVFLGAALGYTITRHQVLGGQ